ncbi:MFS general substrate transporter [Armillaria mellea]|nr:MFS general substrate transporter [Armillaria mellea]
MPQNPSKLEEAGTAPFSSVDNNFEKGPSTDEGISTSEELFVVDRIAEKRLLRQLDLRILPSCMFIYTLNFLARANIGNAKILNADSGDSLLQVLDMTSDQFSTVLTGTPSNYMLKHFSPPHWFAFLMNFSALTGLRFLLGAFEAGFYPGIIYFLTFWYRPQERALRLSFIAACTSLSGAFGGSIAYGVGLINGSKGLEAWRWLFIIEGAPSCALAVARFRGEASLGYARITWAQTKDTLTDWRLISYFAPTIVNGLGYEGLRAQLFTVPPFAIAFVATVICSAFADRYEAWSTFAWIPMVVSGVTFIIQGALPPTAFKARYAMLCLSTTFSNICNPSLITWLTVNLRNTDATTLAIPLIVTIGTIGQITGVYIYKANEAPGYRTGHFTNGAFLLAGSLVILVLREVYRRRNRNMTPGSQLWRV